MTTSRPLTASFSNTEDVFSCALPKADDPSALPLPSIDGRPPRPRSTSGTTVNSMYRTEFSEYELRHWRSFRTSAARHLVEDDKRVLRMFKSYTYHLLSSPAATEAAIRSVFDVNVLFPLSYLVTDVGGRFKLAHYDKKFWDIGAGLQPDYVVVREKHPEVVEPPNCAIEAKKLGIDICLAVEDLRACFEGEEIPVGVTGATFNAILQILAYARSSRSGLGVLTNYNETRFFWVCKERKIVLCSDVVQIDTLRNTEGGRPHILQAFLYLIQMCEDLEDEDKSKALIERHLSGEGEGGSSGRSRDTRRQNMLQRGRTLSRSTSGRKKRKRGSGSTKSTDAPAGTTTTLTQLHHNARSTPFAAGFTGFVYQTSSADRQPVVLKCASPKDKEATAHIENEIEMYRGSLHELQGDVVPKVINDGRATEFSPPLLILATTMVGEELTRERVGFCLGGVKLDEASMMRLRDLSLGGLRRIHAHDVLHGDIRCPNIRAEFSNGEVCRVWWIDFGSAEMSQSADSKINEEGKLSKMLGFPVAPSSPI